MNRGDVVRVQLPPPAGPSGREQVGTRPAIVLQDKAATANLSTVIIVPLTSRLAAMRFVGSFTVSPTDTNGLSAESVVLTHQLRAIDQRRVEEVIGTLADDHMVQLEAELRVLLAL